MCIDIILAIVRVFKLWLQISINMSAGDEDVFGIVRVRIAMNSQLTIKSFPWSFRAHEPEYIADGVRMTN